MAASIIAKTAPSGKVIGNSVLFTTLFTFTDSVAADYNFQVAPNANGTITSNGVTFNKAGSVTVTASLAADPQVNASVTINVGIPRADKVTIISTKHDNDGHVLIGVICADGYDGKWSIKASPDGINYLPIENLQDQVASVMVTLPYLAPYFKFDATAGTVGSCTLNVFGSGVSSVE